MLTALDLESSSISHFTVSYFLVVALVRIVGILRKDQRTVHQRIDHYHDAGNYNHHRNQTLQQTFK